MKTHNGTIMTIDEVALYLKLHIKTTYRLVKNGKIPGFKIGGSWRFNKNEIDDWISRGGMPNETN